MYMCKHFRAPAKGSHLRQFHRYSVSLVFKGFVRFVYLLWEVLEVQGRNGYFESCLAFRRALIAVRVEAYRSRGAFDWGLEALDIAGLHPETAEHRGGRKLFIGLGLALALASLLRDELQNLHLRVEIGRLDLGLDNVPLDGGLLALFVGEGVVDGELKRVE